MEIMHRGIVALLHSAATAAPRPLPQGFDLEAAYPLICQHQIGALAYSGAALCGLPRNTPVMQKLFLDYCRALQRSEMQMRLVKKLFAAFDAAGVDYLPLKGVTMKALYPQPELRYMGDADILIRKEQYDRIRPIMAGLGYTEKQETDHELQWTQPGLYVELHKWLIPSYNKDLHVYFEDCWRFAQKGQGSSYRMPPEDEWVYLFAHFAKHFRDGGIGCRYVLDLWMFLKAHPELDEALVEKKMAQVGLEAFHGHIRRLIRCWFDGQELEDISRVITEYIFASGSWGAGHSRVLSRAVRDLGSKKLPIGGKLLYTWQTLFPEAKVLEEKYTVLKKAPWMLPAVWVARPFYKVFCEPATLKKQKTNLEHLDQAHLDGRRAFLSALGLEYRF